LVPAEILEVLRHEVDQPQEIALDNLEDPSKLPIATQRIDFISRVGEVNDTRANAIAELIYPFWVRGLRNPSRYEMGGMHFVWLGSAAPSQEDDQISKMDKETLDVHIPFDVPATYPLPNVDERKVLHQPPSCIPRHFVFEKKVC
jgi:hypothetical protein